MWSGRNVLFVSPQVLLQVALLRESFLADVAAERPFARVHQNMYFESGLTLEALSAHITAMPMDYHLYVVRHLEELAPKTEVKLLQFGVHVLSITATLKLLRSYNCEMMKLSEVSQVRLLFFFLLHATIIM